jgi:hypothetical protein
MHLLLITGLPQLHRVPDPFETALLAITGLPILGRLEGVMVVGQLLFGGETHRTPRVALVVTRGLASIRPGPHPSPRGHFWKLPELGRAVTLVEPSQEAHPILADRPGFCLPLSLAAWASTICKATTVPLVPAAGGMPCEPGGLGRCDRI